MDVWLLINKLTIWLIIKHEKGAVDVKIFIHRVYEYDLYGQMGLFLDKWMGIVFKNDHKLSSWYQFTNIKISNAHIIFVLFGYK